MHSSTEITVANALKSSASALEIHFGQSMNRRALTKWGICAYSISSEFSPNGLTVAQLGHSAVDVNLIGYATKQAFANLEKIRGNHDNTGEVFMRPFLQIMLNLFQRSDCSLPTNCS
jgi:hypothetical protein